MGILGYIFGNGCSCSCSCSGSCQESGRSVKTRPSEDIPVCEDCRYSNGELCNNPKRINQMASRTAVKRYDDDEYSVVSEAKYQRRCSYRQYEEYYTNEEGTRDICGPEGKWFEPRS